MQAPDRYQAAYDPGVPRHLTYPEIPLHALLERTARERPDAAATIFGGAVAGRCLDAALTYGQLDALADRFAAGLQGLGVRKGDRVALVLPNCPQFVYAFYGTLKAGAVAVPTNPLYTVRELRHQLADSGARAVVKWRSSRRRSSEPAFQIAYSNESARADAEAAMMLVSLPIVDQVRAPSIESMMTRVRAAVAAPPSRIRTL